MRKENYAQINSPDWRLKYDAEGAAGNADRYAGTERQSGLHADAGRQSGLHAGAGRQSGLYNGAGQSDGLHAYAGLNAVAKRNTAGIIVCAVIVALAVVMIIGATPYFSISGIEVGGNQYYKAGLLISKSGLRVGQNGFTALKGDNILKILSFRCVDAEKNVAASCPYIKTIQIKYLIPGTIRIEIEERSKSVVVPYFETGLIIDGEGVIVDIVKNYRESELPVVTGLKINNFETGKIIGADDAYGLETVLSIVNALRQVDRDSEEALAFRIAAIEMGDPDNITLALHGGLNVNLGDGTDLYYRVSFAKEIIANGVGGEKGDIVFTNGARPVFRPASSVGGVV